MLKVAIVGLREKPSFPLRPLRPLREARFVVELASDEAHHNCFRRANRRGPGCPELGAGAQRGMRRMVPEGRKAEDGLIHTKYPLKRNTFRCVRSKDRMECA